MVIRDIASLIIPSAQAFAIYGALYLNNLIENINESQRNIIPFYRPRPQPDYFISFARSAFIDQQLRRLIPFISDIVYRSNLTSFFIAISQIYFLFLIYKVKYGAIALDIADRQNAYNMTLAVRGIIELFKLVKREKELYREIFAFLFSHDYRTVRIYGHYIIIEKDNVAFYRYLIYIFNIIILNSKEKQTAYKFIKNIYNF